MVNLTANLEQFIVSTPTCHQNSSLTALIAASNDGSQGAVALVDDDLRPQGVVWSHHLLRFISQPFFWQQRLDSVVWQDYSTEIVTKLSCLSARMSLQNFLVNFYSDDRSTKKDYFVVDYQGKFLGILDLARIFAEVCSDSLNANFSPTLDLHPLNSVSQERSSSHVRDRLLERSGERMSDRNFARKKQKESISLPKLNPVLYALLTQVSFPVRVENSQGEICYQNSHWLALEKKDSNLISQLERKTDFAQKIASNEEKPTQSLSLDSILKENQNRNILFERDINSNLEHNHCSTVINTSLTSATLINLQRQINQMNSSVSELEEEEKIQIEQKNLKSETGTDWNYYSIPLMVEENDIYLTQNPNYRFKLAIKSSLKIAAEEQNYRRELTDELKQLQDELLLNISHDIKSPLTAIIGLASLLKEEKLGQLNSSQIRYSQMIYHSGKKLINLINDFLNLTRLTTRKFQLQPEPLDLETFCRQVYERMIGKLKTSATIKTQPTNLFPELQLDIDPRAKTAIADPVYLDQILTSLLEISRTLTSEGELLGIVTECWSNYLAIVVWNEGGGLSDAEQNLIVCGLNRDSSLLTSPAKKLVLNLILAQQLARIQGGDISFVSQNNYGSEFAILLPLEEGQDSCFNARDIAINNDRQNYNSLILIIEHKAKIIVDLTEKFKSLGYHCAVARNSADALYKARCLQPQKIIFNSSLIESNKPNLIHLLQADEFTCNIPLIAIAEPQTDCHNFSDSVEKIVQFPLSKAKLAQFFPPIVPRESNLCQNLTVLRLSLAATNTVVGGNSVLDFVFENLSSSLCHHIIEADSLEQAELLAHIWHLDVIIWDGATLNNPEVYLKSFAKCYVLATIPLITLDAKTTAAANQITQLSVFPCLLPENECSIEHLTQVIQIAAGFG